ncbi:MAG: hydrolase [Oscillochloris sp.]|nr:hydrolase [Oscillochloris sp.]
MTAEYDYAPAIARCLAYPEQPTEVLVSLVREVLDASDAPSRDHLRRLQEKIEAIPGAANPIALVYGGATKIKDYVFEAPKLPEIRGASALLDWVNERGLSALWGATLGEDPEQNRAELTRCGIVYASGGNFLAFAPAPEGMARADAIERTYADWTLTAQSAAVAIICSLIELRFGRNPLAYWVDDFVQDCAIPQRAQQLLDYYYPPERVEPKDRSKEALQRRFFNRKSFNELVTLLNTLFYRRREELQKQQEPSERQSRDLPHYELTPWSQKCATSDIRPAIVSAPPLPNQPLLSEASARKAYVGRKLKRDKQEQEWFTKAFSWQLSPWPETWENKFLNHPLSVTYASLRRSKDAQPAQDVGEIGQASRPRRYIGLIYADGNNVARYMGTTQNPGEYAQRAHALTKAAQEAVFSALAEHLQPTEIINEQGQREWVHPFEILTIGGDDMILIVPGSKALDIALSMGLAFERLMGNPAPRPALRDRYRGELGDAHSSYTPEVGLSAGVVIAQENLPIFFLRSLAEQLLKSAKKLARDRSKDNGGGAIDFMVLKSITMITDQIDTFRAQALGDDAHPTKKTCRRTARPYTWHELDGLLHTARALQRVQFPRSQLYRLRGMLDSAEESGPLVSSLEYLATRSRLSRYAETLLKHVEGPWQSVNTPLGIPAGIPPWLKMAGEGLESIWPDLAEIYEFVEAGQTGDQRLREEIGHA